MTLSIKNGRYAFMKGVPIITNFKQPIYQAFD